MDEGNKNLVYPSSWDFKSSFLHAVKSSNMGPSGFISHLRELCAADFYRPEKSIALTGFESANFGYSGKHTNHNTTKATIRRVGPIVLLNFGIL
jgi:hypothetical protein